MRFQLENQWEQFDFHDSRVVAWKWNDNMHMELDGAIGKGTNPCNEELVPRYIEGLQIHLCNASVKNIVIEGYKYYDANDVLIQEVPDKAVPALEWGSIIKQIVQAKAFIYQILPTQENEYQFYIDMEDEDNTTYIVSITFEKAVMEWENFQNRVMQ